MSLTVGVWGTDHPHGGGHLRALESLPEVGSLLVFDEDRGRAQAAVDASTKAELADSADALLDTGAVNAIVCLLPTREAGPATLRAIEAGLYVYGDKPGARTVADRGTPARMDISPRMSPADNWATRASCPSDMT